MTFLTRLAVSEPYETWPRMLNAAEQRYWDALALAVSEGSHESAAIYLFGYVAEMLLKTAYFQFIGVPTSRNIAQELRLARTHALWTGRNLHDLKSWGDFLIDIRLLRGNPLNLFRAGEVRRNVLLVDAHWRETLRYTAFRASSGEMHDVLTGVEWLRTNHGLLWR